MYCCALLVKGCRRLACYLVSYFGMMADNNGNPIIEKLDKNNYPSWKFRVTNFFIGKGLYEFVSSEEKEPELSEPMTANELKAWKEWNAKDKKVMYWLSAVIDNICWGISEMQKVHMQLGSCLKICFL